MHVDAILKNSESYEHINPGSVGNRRVILVSEASGASNLLWHAGKLGVHLEKSDQRLRNALASIKKLEEKGYGFDMAPASAMLVLLSELGLYK